MNSYQADASSAGGASAEPFLRDRIELGMGATFRVDPARGSVELDVPVATTPGRQGFGPRLSITYRDQTGNGCFGEGWSLSVPSISRRRTKLGECSMEEGEDSELFQWSLGVDLVPEFPGLDRWQGETESARAVVENATTYRVRRFLPSCEVVFSRIERWESDSGDSHWRITDRECRTEIFGASSASRIFDPSNHRDIHSWLLEEIRDDRGNVASFEYDADPIDNAASSGNAAMAPGLQAPRYLKRIRYGNTNPFHVFPHVFEVVFDYGDHPGMEPTPLAIGTCPDRPDPFVERDGGFEVWTRRLCRRVLMFHRFDELGPDPVLVRSTRFEYQSLPDSSHLVAIHVDGGPKAPVEMDSSLVFAYATPRESRMGGAPVRGGPSLLVAIEDRKGTRIDLVHASSTEFMLVDQVAGSPWPRPFPLAIQVVEKVEITGGIPGGGRTVSSYAYHQGDFDGEVAGFGHVQQWKEEIPESGRAGLSLRIETWCHTGACTPGLPKGMDDGIYQGTSPASALPGWGLAEELDPDEIGDAQRALRGKILRQELYSQAKAEPPPKIPYQVVESAHAVRRIQPRRSADARSRPVVFAYLLENRTTQYDGDGFCRGIRQKLILEIDRLGAVTRSASVRVSRRRTADSRAPSKAEATHVAVSTSLVAHQDEASGPYRLEIPLERRGFELSGMVAPRGGAYAAREIDQAFQVAEGIGFDVKPSMVHLQKRQFQATRFAYYDDQLSGTPLPWGKVGRSGLRFRSWQAAFTPSLLSGTFDDRVDASLLESGGYETFAAEEGVWWAKSTRRLYDRHLFFQPVGSVDAWDNLQSQAWDRYGLLVTSSTDAMHNTQWAENQYCLLVPWKFMAASEERGAFECDGRRLFTALPDSLQAMTLTFDLMGRVCKMHHPDLGTRLVLFDASGAALRIWEEPDHPLERSHAYEYDELRRPVGRRTG